MTIKFHGESDDLIEVDNNGVQEEYNTDSATFLVVTAVDNMCHVSVRYHDNGCWYIAYGPVDEDRSAPTGIVTVRGYTAELVLDGDVGSVVKRIHD